MDRPYGMLALTGGLEFSRNTVISEHLTLRRMCERYRDAGGRGWVGNGTVPELDGSLEEGQMCRMRGFPNIVGHPCDGRMLGYECIEFGDMQSMLNALVNNVSVAADSGMLWCPPLTVEYRREDGKWLCGSLRVSDRASAILDAIDYSMEAPLSAYSCHAYYEAQRIPAHSPLREIFTYDSQVTPVAGMLGTLHNNTAIDVCVDEDPNVPDIAAREFQDRFEGIFCAGHTAHSQDAGIARRVTLNVDARIFTRQVATDLRNLLALSPGGGRETWTLFCMGYICSITEATAIGIWEHANELRMRGTPNLSVYLLHRARVTVISISSGVLAKRMSDGGYYDSCELHGGVSPAHRHPPPLVHDTDDQLETFFSPFFSVFPCLQSDRPPRPLMASVQTQQAVCTPWSPGTAAVSPCYTTRPLVRTKMTEEMLSATGDDVPDIADEVPGFDVCICFANLPENYEDAMVISQRFVDMGGFSSTAICHYLLPLGEYVPPDGFPLCSQVCRWWKSKCPSNCKHRKPREGESPRRVVSVDRNPTGTVISSRITASGEVSVSVLSYSPLQTGDKISTPHGQKGVSNILPPDDMPYGLTRDGDIIYFDIIMAISSVVNRQTNGQVYEAALGVSALRKGAPVIYCGEKPDIEQEVTLVDGITGRENVTVLDGRELVVSRATFGFTRALSQTQMVRERHHVTHFVPGARSITAPKGRSRGGPVRLGEMDIQAMVSIGLVSCAKELLLRGNMVDCDVCTKCRRLRLLCQCDGGAEYVTVTMPYGTLVLDVTMAATDGCAMEYELEQSV